MSRPVLTPARVLVAAAVVAVVGALTLAPRSVSRPLQSLALDALAALPWRGTDIVVSSGADLGLNVLLFVPLGAAVSALLPLAWSPAAIVFGAGLSTVIEVAQSSVPGRVSDISDVVANTAGAVIGTAIVVLVRAVSAAWQTYARMQPAVRERPQL